MYPVGERAAAERAATATFTMALPPALCLRVPLGRWHPCLHRCRVDVLSGGGVVTIGCYDLALGYAQHTVLDQAVRFLDQITRGADLAASSAPAVLWWPGPDGAPKRETYRVTFGARVAIARSLAGLGAPVLVG